LDSASGERGGLKPIDGENARPKGKKDQKSPWMRRPCAEARQKGEDVGPGRDAMSEKTCEGVGGQRGRSRGPCRGGSQLDMSPKENRGKERGEGMSQNGNLNTLDSQAVGSPKSKMNGQRQVASSFGNRKKNKGTLTLEPTRG